MIDSFGAVVLEKNTEEILKFLHLINQMKGESKYQRYFQVYSINQLFREFY